MLYAVAECSVEKSHAFGAQSGAEAVIDSSA